MPMSNKEYVSKKGGICPVCGSDQVEGDDIDITGDCAFQDMGCIDCDAEWRDEYKLVGYMLYERTEKP